ncbi:MATE family efflux transporter [Marinitoga sp. 38H-ov]|uniref:MATE family efflux transporter n=1 Tax=Marinitoga sp. 38H-ov TaxID=1755814 RepID=UPI0013EC7350|nr:MATE family efflux transporter [Marinitoga sp. 38H-ov]KAF2955540.1 MATE family efflux transporter [Marinitoga sp. 38H-ov]
MSQKNNKVDIFNHSIIMSLFLLGWPMIVSNLMQTMYNIVDAYFLGKVGKIEFSATTITWPLIFVFIAFTIGFSNATVSLVSQYTGAKNKKMSQKTSGQAYLVAIILGFTLALMGILVSDKVISLVTDESSKEVIPYAIKYFNIIMIGMPFAFLFNISSSILRGWGDSKFSMHMMFYSTLLNTILDPIMIFGFGPIPKMGVVGAAWATTISRIFIGLTSSYLVFKGEREFKVHLEDLKTDWNIIRKIFVIGFPGSLSHTITSLGFVVIMGFVSAFGPSVVSAYGIGNRIINLITMISFGISAAVTTMIGQFLGANQINNAEKTVRTAFVINFTIVAFLSTLTFLFGSHLTKFFINEPEVIEIGNIFFKYVSFSLPFFASMGVFVNTLIGAGRTGQSMIVDIARLWGIRVPLIAIMAKSWGFMGIFYAMIISNILALIIAWLFVRFGNWKKAII